MLQHLGMCCGQLHPEEGLVVQGEDEDPLQLQDDDEDLASGGGYR